MKLEDALTHESVRSAIFEYASETTESLRARRQSLGRQLLQKFGDDRESHQMSVAAMNERHLILAEAFKLLAVESLRSKGVR